jgi:hypothetical protein
MKSVAIFAFTAAMVLGAAPAMAKDIPAGGLTIQEMQQWLLNEGYRAQIKNYQDGDQYISSSAEGTNFTIDMYDCKNGRCASLQFESAFDLTNGISAAKVNEWNNTKRYARAVIDDQGDPSLRYDANLSPARTYEGFSDDFAIFRGFISDFKTFIGF